jgi:molybdopterin-containing oxidoreductase family membrane subunit
MMTCNVVSPQVMWFKKIRTSILVSFIISIVVNVGMWFERFVIIVTSLHRDYLPSSWTMFSPTFVDIGIFIGTIGFFFTLFLLYARTFPVIAQAEVKSILKSSGEKYKKLREAGKPLYEVHTTSRIKEKVVTERSHPVDTNKMEVASLLDRIGVFNAATDTPDNLQKIKGIGPQMEQTLNQIGIYTYAQLSRMNQEEYILLDSITGSFPGRAQRDDWAGQAERLNTNR